MLDVENVVREESDCENKTTMLGKIRSNLLPKKIEGENQCCAVSDCFMLMIENTAGEGGTPILRT